MFHTLITTAILLATVSLLAPDWAGPANTALLIILTIVTAKLHRKADDIHGDVSSAAAAALAAAEAAAQAAVVSADSARITREIGGSIRHINLPNDH